MRRWTILLAILGFVCALPGVAVGYWLSSPAPATIRVAAGSLPAGLAPVAVAHGRTVTITTTPVDGAEAYLIRRFSIDGSVAGSLRCGVSCVETGVPDGRWVYVETPLRANWQGPASAPSPPILIDATAPTPVLISPSATADRTPTLIGRAGHAAGDASTVLVRLYAGARLIGHRNIAVHAGQWRWTVGPLLAQRSYLVSVEQRDSAGNVGRSRSDFVIDTHGPDVRLAPVQWPALSGQAGANAATSTTSADSPVVSVQIFTGTRLVSTLSTTRTGRRWALTGTGLGSGDYTARAVQRDAAGNVSISQVRKFSVDATAPVVSVEVPAYVRTAPILHGRAGQASGDDTTVLVEVAAVGGPVGQRLRVPVIGGNWQAVLRPLKPGRRYQAMVSQVDAAGNQGSSTADFVVDITPPKVTIAFASGMFSGRAGTQTGTDQASPDEATVTLEFSQDGHLISSASVPVLAGGYSSVAPQLPAGSYQVVAVQQDAAGNVGRSAPIAFTVAPTAD